MEEQSTIIKIGRLSLFRIHLGSMLTTQDCLQTQCPIQFVLDMLGGKWSILILRELWTKDRRTHELLKALPGISTKTLTIRLRNLEMHGLVERQVFPEIPPRVEYTLTEKGKQLQPVFTALYQVGQQWLQQEMCTCPIKDYMPIERVALDPNVQPLADQSLSNPKPQHL